MPVDDPQNSGKAAYNPDPILLLGRLGRSWGCGNVAVWDCESRFEATMSGDRGCWSDPDSVIVDEIAISHAGRTKSATVFDISCLGQRCEATCSCHAIRVGAKVDTEARPGGLRSYCE